MPDDVPITRSHTPELSVFRTKPRRWAHHTYSTGFFNSRPTRSAIRFSKPSRAAFENGRLLGSAQTLRGAGPWWDAGSATRDAGTGPPVSANRAKASRT